jgi:hypothetical protein
MYTTLLQARIVLLSVIFLKSILPDAGELMVVYRSSIVYTK